MDLSYLLESEIDIPVTESREERREMLWTFLEDGGCDSPISEWEKPIEDAVELWECMYPHKCSDL